MADPRVTARERDSISREITLIRRVIKCTGFNLYVDPTAGSTARGAEPRRKGSSGARAHARALSRGPRFDYHTRIAFREHVRARATTAWIEGRGNGLSSGDSRVN